MVFKFFALLAPYVCYHIFSYVLVTEWPPIWKIAAHSAYEMCHGLSTLLLLWFFPASVSGVGIFF